MTEKKQNKQVRLTLHAFKTMDLSWEKIVIADAKFKMCAQYAIESFNKNIRKPGCLETCYGQIHPEKCTTFLEKQFPYLRQCFQKTEYCIKASDKIADNAMHEFSEIIAPYISFKNIKLVELVLPIAFFVMVMNNETSRHYIDKKQEFIKALEDDKEKNYVCTWEKKRPLVLNKKGKNNLTKINFNREKAILTLLKEAGISISLDLQKYNEKRETIDPSDFEYVEKVDYLELFGDIVKYFDHLWDVSYYGKAGLFLSEILQASFEQNVRKGKTNKAKKINDALRDLLLQLYIINSLDCFLNKLDTDYESLSELQQFLRCNNLLLTAFFRQKEKGIDPRVLSKLLDTEVEKPKFGKMAKLYSFCEMTKDEATRTAIERIVNCKDCSFDKLYTEIEETYIVRNNAMQTFYINTKHLHEGSIFLDTVNDVKSLISGSISSIKTYINTLIELQPKLIKCYKEINKEKERELIRASDNSKCPFTCSKDRLPPCRVCSIFYICNRMKKL